MFGVLSGSFEARIVMQRLFVTFWEVRHSIYYRTEVIEDNMIKSDSQSENFDKLFRINSTLTIFRT